MHPKLHVCGTSKTEHALGRRKDLPSSRPHRHSLPTPPVGEDHRMPPAPIVTEKTSLPSVARAWLCALGLFFSSTHSPGTHKHFQLDHLLSSIDVIAICETDFAKHTFRNKLWPPCPPITTHAISFSGTCCQIHNIW